MSFTAKYYASKAIVALTVPAICYSLAKMIPAGLNGDADTAKRWFAVSAVIAIIGALSLVTMNYTKARLSNRDGSHTEAEILATASADITPQRQASSVSISSKNTPPKSSSDEEYNT